MSFLTVTKRNANATFIMKLPAFNYPIHRTTGISAMYYIGAICFVFGAPKINLVKSKSSNLNLKVRQRHAAYGVENNIKYRHC